MEEIVEMLCGEMIGLLFCGGVSFLLSPELAKITRGFNRDLSSCSDIVLLLNKSKVGKILKKYKN